MTTALFEISETYRSILARMSEWADEHDGDVTEFPLLEEMNQIEGDLDTKVENIALFIRELNTFGNSIIGEGKPFQDLAESYFARGQVKLNQAARLKKYIEDFMPKDRVIETHRIKINWQGNGGVRAVELMPEVKPEDLPKEFQKSTITADVEKIRVHLEATIDPAPALAPEKTGKPLELIREVAGKPKLLAIVKPRGKSLRFK